MKKGWLILIGLLLNLGGMGGWAPVPEALAAVRLLEIRHWAAPDHTRVVIDLDGPPVYEAPPSTDPLILLVHLREVTLAKGRQEISVNDRIIKKIQIEPRGPEAAELTVFLVKPSRCNLFVLKPYLDKPDRLVIDVARPDLEEKEKAERQVGQDLKGKKVKIIVLDAGHGGEDPGAIGPKGTLEKNIVLAVAKRLQKILDEGGEFRAFLTRRGDYFLVLEERVKIAQEYGADLFISIHANGNKKPQVRGTSLYCLSLKGASDQATQLLAQKENASDMVGGASLAPVHKDLDSILLDLEQTHTINESLRFGGLALNELSRVHSIQFTQPRQAGFRVLRAPNIPSILVEVAYITNPVEEKRLQNKSFQGEVSQAIKVAIKKYMPVLAVREGRGGQGPPRPKKQGT